MHFEGGSSLASHQFEETARRDLEIIENLRYSKIRVKIGGQMIFNDRDCTAATGSL